MKKLSIIALALFPFAIFAQTATPPDAIDNIISFVLGIAAGIPAIGAYLPLVLKILALVAVFLTAASSVLLGLKAAFNLAGLDGVANFIGKILPYVQYASMFNVQKS